MDDLYNINNNQNVKNSDQNNDVNKPLPEVFKELKEARNKQFIEEKINANKISMFFSLYKNFYVL